MRDISLCHPRLQQLAAQWETNCRERGIRTVISETLRTREEQDALYAQGRTRPGPVVTNARGSEYRSQHQWGIAFDFYLRMDVDGDGLVSDDSYNDRTGLFSEAASEAKKLGLKWGGDWKSLVDKPHIYLPDWGNTPASLIRKYGTPEKFMASWEPLEQSGWQKENGGWRFYFRDGSGRYVINGWYEDNGRWYWFDGAGMMVSDVWYRYKENWYYLGPDGAMAKGQQTIGGKWYVLNEDGQLVTGPVTLTTDQDGALQWQS